MFPLEEDAKQDEGGNSVRYGRREIYEKMWEKQNRLSLNRRKKMRGGKFGQKGSCTNW